MRTPAGTECPFYYEDFHRGRNVQECRLIASTPGGGRYSPDLCAKCRVPRIIMANACPNMVLQARVASSLFGLRRKVEVTASCKRTHRNVDEPEIGCGECHLEFPPIGISGDPT
jgi:hypothetical protein